jgi:hypothetical protein
MQAAFYDLKKDRLVQVEAVTFGAQQMAMTALQLTALWESGAHCLPSPYWVCWDKGEDRGSIFLLDAHRQPEASVFERIESLVSAYQVRH